MRLWQGNLLAAEQRKHALTPGEILTTRHCSVSLIGFRWKSRLLQGSGRATVAAKPERRPTRIFPTVKHIDIRITGKVQGVFFRANTREKARRLGIRGTVRNESDGSVSVQAEGDDDALRAFLEWLHVGPARARVDEVSTCDGPLQNFAKFEIR